MFKSFKVAGIDVVSFTRFRSLSVDGRKRSENASMDTELPIRFCYEKKFILKCNGGLVGRFYAELVVLIKSS